MDESDFKTLTDLLQQLRNQSELKQLRTLIRNFFSSAAPQKRTITLRDSLLQQVYDFYAEALSPRLSDEDKDLVCCIYNVM